MSDPHFMRPARPKTGRKQAQFFIWETPPGTFLAEFVPAQALRRPGSAALLLLL